MSRLPRPLLIVTILAISAKLALIWWGWPETKLIADDAYYYFTIARHLADGLGPTFDTIAPTNGFHPLWQAMLVPLFSSDDLWLPVRLTGTLTALLDLASALLIWRWLRERDLESTGVWAASIWLLAPISFLLGLRGLEASLHATLVFACLWLASRPSPPLRMLGLLIGLASLARTDSPITLGLPIAALLLFDRSRPLAKRVISVAWTGGIALLVFAPWLLWCQIRFGSIVQVSGRIKHLSNGLAASNPWSFGSFGGAFESIAYLLVAFVVKPLRWLAGVEFESSSWWIPFALIWTLAAAMLATRGASALWRSGHRRPLLLLAAFALMHQLVYGVVLRSYSVWYALPLHGLLAILMAAALADGTARSWRRWLPASLFVISYASLALGYVRKVEHGARGAENYWRPRLDAVLEAAPWARSLGLWDAGAVGYVATSYPQLHVVNLDGLVNNEVLAAVREGRYADYILENVDYLVQHPRRARLFLTQEEMREFQAEFEQVRGLRYRSRR